MNELLKQDNYGKKIPLDKANDMIGEFIKLDEIISKEVSNNGASKQERGKAEVLMNRQHNAFIFTKDLVLRFFDGSEEDEDKNPECSKYLIIFLGAHKDSEPGFEAGSFTIVTAGAKRVIDDDTEEVKFYPLNILKPCNEYPPCKVIQQFGDRKDDGSISFEYFLVTE